MTEPKTVDTATLTVKSTGKSFDFPILQGTEGPQVVDVRKL
jgi:citrate synthase